MSTMDQPIRIYTRKPKNVVPAAEPITKDDEGEINGVPMIEEDDESEMNVSVPMIEDDNDESEKNVGVRVTKIPKNLKELLDTGLLEGLHVTYAKGAKGRMPLHGEIRGSSILCFCKDCQGKNKVVTPIQFEIHAGSRNKKPADYIYLDNGKTLRYALNMCKKLRNLLLVEQTIRSATSKSSVEYSCSSNTSAESCLDHTCAADSLLHADDDAQMNDANERSSESVFPSKVKLSASINKSKKKLRKKHSGHKLFFESDLVPDNTALAYRDKEKKMKEGVKEGKLISCNCCHNKFSPSGFEAHAGFPDRRQPYSHICTSDGKSIHLLCLENIPETTLLISDTECYVCGGNHYNPTQFGKDVVIYCDQCTRECHLGCLEDPLESVPEGDCFCTKKCGDIYSALGEKVEDGPKELPESMLSIIQHKQQIVGSSHNLKWRILWSKSKTAPKGHQKCLSRVASLLVKKFGQISYGDSITDLISMMVKGERNDEINFSGMYCAALFEGSKLVCAAIFRIFGDRFAELPLAATKDKYDGKGYCQALIGCVENLLASIGVKELILPATNEAKSFWKNKLAFQELHQEQLDEYLKHYRPMLFDESTMLRKPISN